VSGSIARGFRAVARCRLPPVTLVLSSFHVAVYVLGSEDVAATGWIEELRERVDPAAQVS